jgi:hypothetical protein
VVRDQRERFSAYVAALSQHDLRQVQPLPYRRLLGPDEERRIWARLDERWATKGTFYWYPLNAAEPLAPALALQAEWFHLAVPAARLHQLLEDRGVRRVWEITEGFFSPAYEMNAILIDPVHRGDERYWTAGEMDWLLYASHESSITVAGDWFVAAIKALWPGWKNHVYTGWDYARPSILGVNEGVNDPP